jgi:cell division septum initiation protein DivIVA
MESELLALIEQMELLLGEGGRVPLSSRVMIAPTEAYRLLDLMRQSLPREVVRARHIYQERDRILGEAQVEADALRAAARAEREALIAEHSVTVEAMRAAEAMKREARAECERLRLEADAYALHSLRDLQVQLAKTKADLDATVKTVSGGIEMLESRRD